MTDAEDRPVRRRRRKTTAAQRAQHAAHMREMRAKAKQESLGIQPTSAPVAEVTPPEAAQPAQPSPAPEPEKPLLLTEAQLVSILTGCAQTVADSVQLVALDFDGPHLGEQRADAMARVWAPILLPFVNEDTAKWLPLLFAVGATANAGYSWAREYRQWAAEKAKAPKQLHVVGVPEGKHATA